MSNNYKIGDWDIINNKTCGIYSIHNLINNKYYIGQSIKMLRRWNQHKTRAFNKNDEGYNSELYQDIRRDGLNNFEFKLIEELSNDTQLLNDREAYWIKYYDSYFNGYNETIYSNNFKVNKNEVIDYYNNHHCYIKDLAEHFHIERRLAGNILKQFNKKSIFYVSEEDEKLICQDYINDKKSNCVTLGEKYNRSRDTIFEILKRNNIKMYQNRRQNIVYVDLYDVEKEQIILENVTIDQVVDYLKNHEHLNNVQRSTVFSSVKREANTLYKKYRVMKYKGDK